MRIGFETEHYDPSRGGTEIYVARLVRLLLDAGHEVHLFSGNFQEEPSGAKLHRVNPFRADTVQRAVEAQKLDVVVGAGRGLGMNVFQPHGGTFLGNRRQNLALVRNPFLRRLRSWFNGLVPKQRAAARLEQLQYAQHEPRPRFVAISNMVREDMRRFYGVPDDRLHVIYHGVDTGLFSPARRATLREAVRQEWGLAPGTVCFLLVAHNFRLKGLRELIEAAGRVQRQRRDFTVAVVGKGRPGPYRRLASRHGCGDLVRFLGPLREVERAYAAADVCVQPAWYEPFGLVVLEAWASGLPVIATRFTGAGELMTEGREGFLIDTPADTETLAEKMLALFKVEGRQRMSRHARALAERHTQEHHFREMMAVFQLAAAENSISRRRGAA